MTASEAGAGERSAAQPEPGPEVRVSGREAFGGKLLKLAVDTVRLPSGRETVREVVEHPGAVAILALTTDDRVLLLRHYRYAVGRTLLELPAGTRELGEEPEATARRELQEETRYAAGRLTRLASFFTSPGYSTEEIVLFRADDCRRVPHAPGPEETLVVAPTPRREIPALLAPGADRVQDAKTLIGLLWLLREAE